MLLSQRNILLLQAVLFITLSFSTLTLSADDNAADDRVLLKPFVLAEHSKITMDEAKQKMAKLIEPSPFSIVAEYSPYPSTHIYIITSDELKSLASQSPYGGFAAAQRISLTQVANEIQIAYTNPVYMQHAYRMKGIDMQAILDELRQSFGFVEFFGGDGLTAKQLARYNYAMGLEGFSDFYELPEFETHEQAVAALLSGFEQKKNGISQVYKIQIPGKKQVVFGVAMSAEDSGQEDLDVQKTMQVIDYQTLKRSAYLPYEIMVDEQRIIAMHARFRIASYFYDLKMFGKHGFGKLYSVPHSYLDAFTEVLGGPNPTATLDFLNGEQ